MLNHLTMRHISLLPLLVAAACSSQPEEPAIHFPVAHYTVLPNSQHSLSTSGVQGEVKNAMELSSQKRFQDALAVLERLRSSQPVDSEGYNALTASLSTQTLLCGRLQDFHSFAEELDQALGKPVRVPDEYADVIAIHRAAGKQSMPVNTSPRLREWLALVHGK